MSIELVTREEATELSLKMGLTLLQARDYLEQNPTLRMEMPENFQAVFDPDGFFLEWIELNTPWKDQLMNG